MSYHAMDRIRDLERGGITWQRSGAFSFAMVTIEVRHKRVDLVGFYLTVTSDITGIHWHASLQRSPACSDRPGGNRRQTSTKTSEPNLHQ